MLCERAYFFIVCARARVCVCSPTSMYAICGFVTHHKLHNYQRDESGLQLQVLGVDAGMFRREWGLQPEGAAAGLQIRRLGALQQHLLDAQKVVDLLFSLPESIHTHAHAHSTPDVLVPAIH